MCCGKLPPGVRLCVVSWRRFIWAAQHCAWHLRALRLHVSCYLACIGGICTALHMSVHDVRAFWGRAADADMQVLHCRPCLCVLLPNLCMSHGVQGTIPEEWGEEALFPKLVNLTLSYNEALSGSLPASWGADNSSLTGLQLFQANNCNLTGPLPANWSMNLPALKDINISSNALTGLCLQATPP